ERVADLERVGRLVEHAGAAKSSEAADVDRRRAALLAAARIGHARQTVGDSLKAEIGGGRGSTSPPMAEPRHVAEPERVQHRRRERTRPARRERVVIRTEDLFPFGPSDQQIVGVCAAVTPLAVKYTEHLIGGGGLIIYSRVDPIECVLGGTRRI